MLYYTALTLGLVGSIHCAGMCGPIAIALPLNNANFLTKFANALTYNIGRTITYGIMGLLFGFFGKGLDLVGLQNSVSLISGIIIILSVVFPALYKNRFMSEKLSFNYMGKLHLSLKKLFTRPSNFSLLIIGLVNGLLPCGLVYIALAGALSSASEVQGMIYMLIFGLATAPMLIAI